VHEAKTHLSRLLRLVAAGEDVVIVRNKTAIARLVAIAPATRPLGIDRGVFVVPDDFDEPLPDEVVEPFYT